MDQDAIKMMKKIGIKLLTALFFLVSCSVTFALEDATELAKKAQNPVENMISVPLDSNFNVGFGPHDNFQYILNAKPVIPFTLNDSWNLISRTIIPMIHQPNPTHGYLNGMGDINPTFFLSPHHPGTIIWGIGPTFVLPTATNTQLGQGKYSAGPSFVLLAMPNKWVLGFLIFNYWSIGGQSSRPHVNTLNFQYFINYNLAHGWYLVTSPTLISDWTANSQNRWTIPFGAGVGHVFSIGHQPLNLSVQAYDNVKTPRVLGPHWTLEINLQLLFPE